MVSAVPKTDDVRLYCMCTLLTIIARSMPALCTNEQSQVLQRARFPSGKQLQSHQDSIISLTNWKQVQLLATQKCNSRNSHSCLLLFSHVHYVSAETFHKTSIFKGVVVWEGSGLIKLGYFNLETTESSVLQSLKHSIGEVFS